MPRALYLRSFEALLGVPFPSDVDLPIDGERDGLATHAEGLAVTLLHLEAYEAGTERAVSDALRRPGASGWNDLAVEPDLGDPSTSWSGHVQVPEGGVWRLAVAVDRQDVGVGVPRGGWTLWVDEEVTDSGTLEEGAGLASWTVEVDLTAGYHTLAVDVWPPDVLHRWGDAPLSIEGPLVPEPNPALDALVACDLDGSPEPCLTRTVEAFAARAFRRPVTPDELEGLLALPLAGLASGDAPERALADALEEVMLDPRFLFVWEPHGASAGEVRPLDAWELATRLATLIWMAPPDAELRASAASGRLLEDAELRAQTRRMLADPRAVALADDFLWDWFDMDRLAQVRTDPVAHPGVDDVLRDAMLAEVRELFRGLVGRDRPLRGLVDQRSATLSPVLADWIGLGPSEAGEVDVSGVGRRGLLGTAGVQTMLAYPDRTSPTRRGQYVLAKLLCRPPLPPPGDIPPLPQGSNRDAVELHAADPRCSGCHAEMDPIGLSLEHFDAFGRWRDRDENGHVDASATLPDGARFDGLDGLIGWLGEQSAVERCATDALFTWALGREPGLDAPELEAIAEDIRQASGSLGDLVEALVLSSAFRHHRGAP